MSVTSRNLLVGLLLAPALLAQTARDQDLADWRKKRKNLYWQAGQRHLVLGSWCRKFGLVPQATTQFLRALEVSEGENDNPRIVLGYMRSLGDKFWLGELKRPSKKLLADYATRAQNEERTTRVEKLRLAQQALMIREVEEAKKLYLDLVQHSEKLPVYDDKGRIKLEEGHVPAEIAKQIAITQVTVNGQKVVRDEALERVPKLDDLREIASEQLVLRSDIDEKRCADLHTVASALLPQLEDFLDGRPHRRMSLIVFKSKGSYDAYLHATGRAGAEAARGICDYGAFTTLVCAEGLADPDLHALALHELSHLFFYGTAPAVMPDWYAEGFAETFGGQGTFTWDGKKLVLGGLLRADRLQDLKKAPLPLEEMLNADALHQLTADRDKGLRFYAQSWAFQRYLRGAARPAWRDKFLRWEAQCRGEVVGAVPGKISHNGAEANQRFRSLFGKQLEEVEKEFLAWLQKL